MTKTHITAEAGVPQIVSTREFDAPRELLFRVHTDPELLVQWFGPRELTMTVDHLDARHGGQWRYIHRDADGNQYPFRGLFHGTPSPDGIVQTWEDESAPGPVCMSTITFEERDGRTVLRQNTVFQSVEDRDGYVRGGAERGLRESHQRLDEWLKTPRYPHDRRSDEQAG
jgi:uncharacterized protein YndB with AHSA1/START domain